MPLKPTLILLTLLATTFAARAPAARFQVDTTADLADSLPGDGLCDAVGAPGSCSLRAAVQEANALPGPDGIALPSGRYRLTIAGVGEDAAASGDLDVTDDLTIEGEARGAVVLDAARLDRAFHVPVSGIRLALRFLDIENGRADDCLGGGAVAVGTQSANVDSDLSLYACTLRRNRARAGACTTAFGGALRFRSSAGVVTILECDIVDNEAAAATGGGVHVSGGRYDIQRASVSRNLASHDQYGGVGGGLWLVTGDPASQLIDSSVVKNRADLQAGGLRLIDPAVVRNVSISQNRAPGGGALSAGGQQAARLEHVTITGNRGDSTRGPGGGGGGMSAILPGGIELVNSIVADKVDRAGLAPNCSGPVTSDGGVLLGDDTGCSFTAAAGDLVGNAGSPVNPRLRPLGDHGGPTATHRLGPASPAIELGLATACAPTDQRGLARPQDGDGDGLADCDAGAVERLR